MSSAFSQSAAPLRMRLWQPRLCGESIRPGTANTCRLLSAAMLAVMSAPLFWFASTTTVPSVIPATMRLRIGKLCLSPLRLNGNWVMTAPLSEMRSYNSAFSAG